MTALCSPGLRILIARFVTEFDSNRTEFDSNKTLARPAMTNSDFIVFTEGDTFMHNTFVVFYSDTALFDETMYPSCGSVHPKQTTHVDEPPSNQPDLSDDITIPGDSDDPPPEPNKERCALQPNGVDEVPLEEPVEQQAPPDEPEPVPEPDELPAQPQRSGRIRRPPTRPDNVYGDKHPTKILKTLSGLAIGST